MDAFRVPLAVFLFGYAEDDETKLYCFMIISVFMIFWYIQDINIS